jgi:hypothetical protein
MATITGNDGSIVVGSSIAANGAAISGATIAAVRNFSLDITADTIETTVMGNDSRTYVKGLSSYSGSADIYFDPSEFNASTFFNPTSGTVGQTNVGAKLYITQGASSDDIFWANSIVITGYNIKSSMDGMVEASLSFQGSGATAFNTSANY